jgi:hypothetical protein
MYHKPGELSKRRESQTSKLTQSIVVPPFWSTARLVSHPGEQEAGSLAARKVHANSGRSLNPPPQNQSIRREIYTIASPQLLHSSTFPPNNLCHHPPSSKPPWQRSESTRHCSRSACHILWQHGRPTSGVVTRCSMAPPRSWY